MKKNVILLLALPLILVMACSKSNEGNGQILSGKYQTSIPVYNSTQEVIDIMEQTYTFDSLEQLVDFETGEGRTSIGRTADQFYSTIDADVIADYSSLMAFYDNNKEYLDTVSIDGELAVLPKWKDTPLRYVAGTNGAFIIGKTAYRLFNGCLVLTSVSNVQGLLSLDEDDLDSGLPDKYFVCATMKPAPKSIHDLCDRSGFIRYHKKTSSGNDMIVLKVLTTELPIEPPDNSIPVLSDYFVDVSILNLHKVLGIWWEKKRDTYASGLVRVHKNPNDNNNWSVSDQTFNLPTTHLSSKTINIYSVRSNYSSDVVHIYGYNLSATASGIGTVPLVGGNQ